MPLGCNFKEQLVVIGDLFEWGERFWLKVTMGETECLVNTHTGYIEYVLIDGYYVEL